MVSAKSAPFRCPYGQTPTLPFWVFGIVGDRRDFRRFFLSSRFPVIRHPYALHPFPIANAHPYTTLIRI